MKLMWILLFAVCPLFAEEIPLALAKEYHDVKTNGRDFDVSKDGKFTEVFRDNRKDHCCPQLGSQPVTDPKIESMLVAIHKYVSVKYGKSDIINCIMVHSTTKPYTDFSVETNVYLSDRAMVETYGRACCLIGRYYSDGSVKEIKWSDDPEDSEMVYISKTAKTMVTRWRTSYTEDYDEFLNKVKSTSSFVKDEKLYYLAAEMEDKTTYNEYLHTFEEDRVIRIWSPEAHKVFLAYAKTNKHTCTEVRGMRAYKKWLEIMTDCDRHDNPGPMSSYYLKRIREKWVLVWDGYSFTDPRHNLWIPTKVDEKKPGIGEDDVPKQLRDIQ